MQSRQWILACAAVAATFGVSASARAALVQGGGGDGHGMLVNIDAVQSNETNNITVTLSGITGRNPAAVVVTDSATPLTVPPSSGCTPLSANSARCTSSLGIEGVGASLGSGNDRFAVNPGLLGLLTPMFYDVITGAGSDQISIPFALNVGVETGDGNDTVSFGAQVQTIGANLGAGDDSLTSLSLSGGVVECGPGTDTALVLPLDVTDQCEKTLLPSL